METIIKDAENGEDRNKDRGRERVRDEIARQSERVRHGGVVI